MRTLLILIVLAACSGNTTNENYAQVVKYYFEMVPSKTVANEVELISGIAQNLPNKIYAITNYSGYEWPFYQEYEMNERVMRTDLMTPHVVAHRMIELNSGKDIFENGDVKMEIQLSKEGDEYSFDLIMVKWREKKWEKYVTTRDHRIPKNKYDSNEELIQVLTRSITRFSFK